MSETPAFAGTHEALGMLRAVMGYLSSADATAMATEAQAECLMILGQMDAVKTATRARVLRVEKEQDLLARALARPASQGLAKVHWAPDATWADLQDLLLDREWHVLHFIGHGSFDLSQDEGVLALVREDGRADLVAAHRLVDLLRQACPMPRLVVVNSCSGAAAAVSDLFSGTAAALVRGGVSAVAAMQYEMTGRSGRTGKTDLN